MNPEELKTLNKNINEAWKKMKDVMDEQNIEIKKFGESSQETKSTIEKLNAKIEEFETKMNRPSTPSFKTIGEEQIDEKALAKTKSFNKYLRYGHGALSQEELKEFKSMTPEELKVMTVSDQTTGGFLTMPETLSGEMIKNIVEYSPVRSISRVRSTSARSVKIRKKTGNITGGAWVGEIGSRTNLGSMGYGMIEVPVHELAGYVDISNQDLADVDYNLEQELSLEYSEQFGVTEGAAFITGNGVNKPLGILTTNTDFELGKVANGHATALQADALIDIYYTPKTQYALNSVWMLNRNTLKEVRKLKDGNGNYLWTPAITVAKPSLILERPYVECVDMPDIAANAYPIVFGDIKKLYMVIDRTVIETLRDPYTQAGTGTTRFYAYKRVGGQIILKEAAYKLKIATTV